MILFSKSVSSGERVGPFPGNAWCVMSAGAYPLAVSVNRGGSVQTIHVHGATPFRLSGSEHVYVTPGDAVTMTVATERDDVTMGTPTPIVNVQGGWKLIAALDLGGWLAANTDGLATTERLVIGYDGTTRLATEKVSVGAVNSSIAGIDLTDIPGARALMLGAQVVTANTGLTCGFRSYGRTGGALREATLGGASRANQALFTGAANAHGLVVWGLGYLYSSAPDYAFPSLPPSIAPYITSPSATWTSITNGRIELWVLK